MAVKRLQISPRAERDLDEETLYIAEQNGPETGIRFFDAAHESFQALREMPGMGSVRDYGNPALAGMRMWPVPGFRNYLIFYRASEDGVEIIRVLHGARDIEALFSEE